MITDGSRPAPRRISKTIAATVDLPLVPVTAMVRCSATKCASSSERCTSGTPSRRAAARSGTPLSTAVETTSAAQSPATPLPSWGTTPMPSRSSCARASGALAAVEGAVAAADAAAAHRLELGERAHAAAAASPA